MRAAGRSLDSCPEFAPATTENFAVGTRGLVESLSTAVGPDALTAQAASAAAVIGVASGIL